MSACVDLRFVDVPVGEGLEGPRRRWLGEPIDGARAVERCHEGPAEVQGPRHHPEAVRLRARADGHKAVDAQSPSAAASVS